MRRLLPSISALLTTALPLPLARAGNRHRRLQRAHAARHAARGGDTHAGARHRRAARRNRAKLRHRARAALFLDQTTLSLAPNTTIVLDRFVFDPDRGTGEIGLQLTEGALRFIGGTLSRQQDAVIRTPTSTIGIRGSSALILHPTGGPSRSSSRATALCVDREWRTDCTSRPGGVLTEDGYQGRVAPEFLAFVLGLIDGAPVTAAQGAFGGGLRGTGPGERRAAPARVSRRRRGRGGSPRQQSGLARRGGIRRRGFSRTVSPPTR
jgi:hypothetical protein